MPTRLIRRRLAALRTGRDAGITLMELVVAMTLNVIIGALTVGIFIKVNDSSDTSIDRAVSTASARNAIQDWTAYLRVADGKTAGVKTNRIEWLTQKDMLFYADLYNRTVTNLAVTGAPTMIWLRLDTAGALIEEQFASTATAGTAPRVCRTLAPAVSTPAAALFTGYDSTGAAMTSPLNLGTAPSAGAGCVALPVTVPSLSAHPDQNALANLQNVTSVVIDFVVRDTKGEHPIEFTSQAVLPALGGV
jgi:Tfp pilus assembly protein PilW